MACCLPRGAQAKGEAGPKILTVGVPTAEAICMDFRIRIRRPSHQSREDGCDNFKTAENIPMEVFPAKLYTFDPLILFNSSALARSSGDPAIITGNPYFETIQRIKAAYFFIPHSLYFHKEKG